MEDEIDLRDIIQILWRGKYYILVTTAVFALAAVLYVYFLITPSYRSEAFLNLAPYQVKGKETITLIEQNQVVTDAVKSLASEPDLLAQSITVSVLPDNESVLKIEVEYTDPEVCVASIKRTGVAIIQSVYDYRFEQMNMAKERLERLLLYLDDTEEEYLLSRDNQITVLLEEDPIYKRILEEKAANLVQLNALNFDLKELTENPDLGPDSWLNDQKEPAYLVSVNKKLFMAIALLLGLMLSIFILFVRHYFIATASIYRDGQAGPPIKQNSTRE